MRRACGGVRGLALVVTAACSGGEPAAPEPAPEPAPVEAPAPVEDARPNVLIVLWDTVRADHMSVYGYGKPTTPRLEAFAKEATVYENAVAPGTWTLPSHASMFTGLPGTSHGAKASWRWLDNRFETVAETLNASGYDTFAFSSNLIASPMTNITQGFQTLHTTYPREGAKRGRYTQAARKAASSKLIPTDASTEISPAFAGNSADKWGKSAQKDAAPVLHQGLVDWLDEREEKGKPWFAYLNMMEAHTPRVPSMSARKRVMNEEQIQLGLKTDASLFAENEYAVGKRSYTKAELEAIAGVYDAALVDLDDATGDLLEDLKQRGVLDDTVVIIVADHGEALGEHQLFEHRWSVFEQLTHVPLIIRYPKSFEPGRVKERVSTIDLYATMLDMAETPPPATVPSTSLRKKVYAKQVFVQLLDPFAVQLKSIKEAYPDVDLRPFTRTYCAAYDGAQKLIWSSDGHHGFYNVETDAAEAKNLYAAEVEPAAKLAKALETWEAGLGTYDPTKRSPKDGGRGQKKRNDQGLSREECDQLKMLGYIESCDDASQETPELARDRCGPGAKG